MKRLFIVVEGQSEQEFVNSILRPYFYLHGIFFIEPILIRTSRVGRGGFVNYIHLKNTVNALLKGNGEDVVVTTFVDFFRIPNSLPQYTECMKCVNNNEKVKQLEKNIDLDINDNRFFSYIQLHEFEALLFSNNNGFCKYFTNDESKKTAEIIEKFPNPEEINTRPELAPSKRLLSIRSDYNKPIDGGVISIEIGIEAILDRCSRFREWIQKLIKLCS